jgi:hypothetical protein
MLTDQLSRLWSVTLAGARLMSFLIPVFDFACSYSNMDLYTRFLHVLDAEERWTGIHYCTKAHRTTLTWHWMEISELRGRNGILPAQDAAWEFTVSTGEETTCTLHGGKNTRIFVLPWHWVKVINFTFRPALLLWKYFTEYNPRREPF